MVALTPLRAEVVVAVFQLAGGAGDALAWLPGGVGGPPPPPGCPPGPAARAARPGRPVRPGIRHSRRRAHRPAPVRPGRWLPVRRHRAPAACQHIPTPTSWRKSSLFQRELQRLERVEGAGFHRARRDPEGGGGLSNRTAAIVGLDDDPAVV